MDVEGGTVRLLVAVTGARTAGVFEQACALFSQEAQRDLKRAPAGFRTGSRLPPSQLFQLFGEAAVKSFALSLLSTDVQSQCDAIDTITHNNSDSRDDGPVQLVGRARLLDLRLDAFKPGQQHLLEVEVDLRPRIFFASSYRNLHLHLPLFSSRQVSSPDMQRRIEQVYRSIRIRYQQLQDTEAGYCAHLGDVLLAIIQGHVLRPDGSVGDRLPELGASKEVQVPLDPALYLPDLVNGLLGVRAGDYRQVLVRFPEHNSTVVSPAPLAGSSALFSVHVRIVQRVHLPTFDDELAGRIRKGLTLRQLEEEVRQAVEGERISAVLKERNEAIAAALLACAQVTKVR
ncbi:hypothetical protein EON64_06150 [archaeon]|nr:MAG: hypothetical protein EON64_06150 [archaeon]